MQYGTPPPNTHAPNHPHQLPAHQPYAGGQQAPQQPPAQRVPGLGLSHDGGGFRVHYDGGAFSPQNLVAGAMSGKGFERPRVFGLGLLAIAAVLTVGNYGLVRVLDYYFPYLYSLSAIFGWTGMWLAVTGQPVAQADGSQAPTWGRYGLMACFFIGLLAGAAMVVMPWESAL